MVVNFRAHKINRVTRKLAWIPILIIKKKLANFFVLKSNNAW